MLEPQIISLGVAAPQYTYTQQQIFDAIGYPSHFGRIFRDSKIEQRGYCLPVWRIKQLTFQQQQEAYLIEARRLARGAVLDALDGRPAGDIGALVYCSCTGFAPGPTLAHYLAKDLSLPCEVTLTNISAMGCEGGGYPGLRRAIDFVKATGRNAIVVSCELCSLTYFPEGEKPDPENDYQLLRANSLFGDYSAAAIVGLDDNPRHPTVIDSESYTDTSYLNDLGYTWKDGRLRVLLSRRVPELATEVAGRAVTNLLARRHLTPGDITWWVVHAAGIRVLDMIAERLGLPEEKVQYSKEFLRDHGNCSSATVGGIAKILMQSERPQPGELLAVVTVGPGMTGGCTLAQF